MSRRDTEKDLERPHYFSQYWINIARQYAQGDVPLTTMAVEVDEEDDFAPTPASASRPAVRTSLNPLEAGLDDLPVARPTQKAAPKKPEPSKASLNSLADLAALGFGDDVEVDDLPVGADADDDDVMSRLGANFDDEITPDEEEAASLESLSEEEDFLDEEDEEDDEFGGPRRGKSSKPARPRRPERGY
jgi:hypothetical protein